MTGGLEPSSHVEPMRLWARVWAGGRWRSERRGIPHDSQGVPQALRRRTGSINLWDWLAGHYHRGTPSSPLGHLSQPSHLTWAQGANPDPPRLPALLRMLQTGPLLAAGPAGLAEVLWGRLPPPASPH